MTGVTSGDLFDSALDDIDLDLQLGGREAAPRDVAARILATLPILENLDTRPMEWVGIPQTAGQIARSDTLGRTVEELVELVVAGARKDDAGSFHPSWGYFVQLISYVKGTERGTSPFRAAVSDGAHDGPSSDSFSLTFEKAQVQGKDAIVSTFASLVEVWRPAHGGIFGYEISRRRRGEQIWYPPVGALTYAAAGSGYMLPDDELVDLRPLPHGVLAVLKEWSLDAVLAYGEAFRAVNDGIPRRAAGTG
ncbi:MULTISPECIES: hypothetical protein [unclassified Arthrobacter]|uniref:hypothetical protein n=1 Tax=unclassified Arthrobacter TaxID=235627 RepID=UPI0011B09B8C|nr:MULTISPECIES: hypothetical protein [unclassified Arthrobacter]